MAPTWAVPGLFFRQTTELTLYVPLLSTVYNRKASGRTFESLLQSETFSCISETGRNFQFFRLCESFFLEMFFFKGTLQLTFSFCSSRFFLMRYI